MRLLHLYFGMLFFFISFHDVLAIPLFSIKQSPFFSYDKDIYLYDGNCQKGWISLKKIPLISWYVIYDLYIYPQYRKQGYGQALLSHCCTIIQEEGGKRAYIQPGPFEIVDGVARDVNSDVRDEMIKRLAAFYQKNGFAQVSKMTSAAASLLYRVGHINEDSRFLLVKVFQILIFMLNDCFRGIVARNGPFGMLRYRN